MIENKCEFIVHTALYTEYNYDTPHHFQILSEKKRLKNPIIIKNVTQPISYKIYSEI